MVVENDHYWLPEPFKSTIVLTNRRLRWRFARSKAVHEVTRENFASGSARGTRR